MYISTRILFNRARRQSGFSTFISCQRQDANVLPKRQQLHQGDKLCDVSTVPLVARWPVFLARGSDADGEPHWVLSVEVVAGLCIYTYRSQAAMSTHADAAESIFYTPLPQQRKTINYILLDYPKSATLEEQIHDVVNNFLSV